MLLITAPVLGILHSRIARPRMGPIAKHRGSWVGLYTVVFYNVSSTWASSTT
jgi:hypothetical protein